LDRLAIAAEPRLVNCPHCSRHSLIISTGHQDAPERGKQVSPHQD
jgi:hypothetical protein